MNRVLTLALGVLVSTVVPAAAAPPACVVVTPEVTAIGPVCLDNQLYDTIALAFDPDADLRRARWSCVVESGETILRAVHGLPAGEVLATVPPPDVCILLDPLLADVSFPGACVLLLEVEDRAGETGSCLGASVTYDRMLQE